MKKFIVIVLLLFPSICMGATIWTENYDNGYPEQGKYFNQGSECWSLVTSPVHGGTYSLRIPTNCSLYDEANFTAQSSSTWVWVTFYLYASSNFTPGGTFHLSSLNFGNQYWQLDMRNNSLTGICYDDQNIQNFSPPPTALSYTYFRSKWSKVQWGVQYSTSSIQIWVDDVEIYNQNGNAEGCSYSSNQQAGNINVRVEQMSAYTGYLYYDDVSVDAGSRPTSGDVTPPVMSTPLPSGSQSCGNVTLQVTTDEASTCKYSTTNQAYASMPSTYTTTGGTTHTQILSLACRASYTYYSRCQDAVPNVDTSSATHSFSILGNAVIGTGTPNATIGTGTGNWTIAP